MQETNWNINNNGISLSRALIFDSVFDPYKWVLAYVKVVDWSFKAWNPVYLIHSQTEFTPTEVGYFKPDYCADKELNEWQIWYIMTWEKSVRDVRVLGQDAWREDVGQVRAHRLYPGRQTAGLRPSPQE